MKNDRTGLRVRLLHWKAAEATITRGLLRRAEMRRKAGLLVEYDETVHSALMRKWRERQPAAFVIDLSRLPSRGRAIAIAIRQSPKTRQAPIIFCEGAPEKVKLIREVLPDAPFCQAEDMMNRYGSRTTDQKLSLIPASTVAVRRVV